MCLHRTPANTSKRDTSREVSVYLHASVPYGCHRDGKISPSKILQTGSNTYENT